MTALGRSEDQLETECTWTCVTSGGQEADEFMRLAAPHCHQADEARTAATEAQPTGLYAFVCLCVCVWFPVIRSGKERSGVDWGKIIRFGTFGPGFSAGRQAATENLYKDNKTPLF